MEILHYIGLLSKVIQIWSLYSFPNQIAIKGEEGCDPAGNEWPMQYLVQTVSIDSKPLSPLNNRN